jgi:predicted MFS family arabinose efflux permease
VAICLPSAPETGSFPPVLSDPAKRNVLILAICQALYMTGTSLMIATSPLAGKILTPAPGWETLPLATHHAGVMLATIPASHLMRRIGRRAGFMFGTIFGVIGAIMAGYGMLLGSFWMLCAGACVIGWFNGFAVFYRFAAADTASDEFKPKAISWVMTGGLFAAFLGPELANMTKDMLSPTIFAGSYFALIGVYVISFFMLMGVQIPKLSVAERKSSGRPLVQILMQPKCAVAVTAAFIAYGVMALLMTSTPLAMLNCGFEFSDSKWVIQAHIIGMFAPSFFTGDIIKKFGALNVILCGAVLMMAAVTAHLSGIEFANFTAGLLLVGVGWNFMFIGATTLLTDTYRPEERAKVQGFNDFLIFATVATAALSSGHLLNAFDWDVVNYGVAPLLAIAVVCVIFLKSSRTGRA